MKTKLAPIFFLLFLAFAVYLFLRPGYNHLTYYQDVQPIISKNCMPCHEPNGAAQLSFTTYDEVAGGANIIKLVLQNGEMPPWKPDPEYRHFAGERVLSKSDKETLLHWIDAGKKTGEPFKGKAVQIASALPAKTKPDYQLGFNKRMCVSGLMSDTYVYYPFFLNNSEELNASDFELQVDNKKIVHHAWLLITDKEAFAKKFPEWASKPGFRVSSVLDVSIDSSIMINYLLYTPGNNALSYTPGLVKKIPKNAVVIVEMHYFDRNGEPECDSSLLNIYLNKAPVDREVDFEVIDEKYIANPPLLIPADSVKSFVLVSKPLDEDISLLKISPHMHFRGQKIKAFAVTPANDTIKLIKIDRWDLFSQGMYSYSPLLKLPKGTRIITEAYFDNRAINTNNPVLPPVEVHKGYRSKDEMFQLAIEYVLYKSGDEKISTIQVP